MGFFNLFKKKKESALTLPDKYSGGFIQPLTSQRLEIKLGEKLIVNEGWSVCIVAKDKPLDVFSAGEYELTLPMLPKTTRALKLDKSRIVKKGGRQEVVFKNSFKCDLYFVNMSTFKAQPWQTGRIGKKNKEHGRYSVVLNGVCDFRTTNVADTIKLFLIENAKISSGKAQARLLEYISEFANKSLEWSRVNDPVIINNKQQIAAQISADVQKDLKKYGIEISNFVVEDVIFDRNISAFLEQKKRDEPEITNESTHEIDAKEIADSIDLNTGKVGEVVTVKIDRQKEEDVQEGAANNDKNSAEVVDLSTPQKEKDEAEPVVLDKVVIKKKKKEEKSRKKNKNNDIIANNNLTAGQDKIGADEGVNLSSESEDNTSAFKNLHEDMNVQDADAPKIDFTEMSDAELLKSIVKKGSRKTHNEEVVLVESTKKCPNCGKVHDIEDKICDCGCNLE